jgi:hypothetical protein
LVFTFDGADGLSELRDENELFLDEEDALPSSAGGALGQTDPHYGQPMSAFQTGPGESVIDRHTFPTYRPRTPEDDDVVLNALEREELFGAPSLIDIVAGRASSGRHAEATMYDYVGPIDFVEPPDYLPDESIDLGWGAEWENRLTPPVEGDGPAPEPHL